MNVLPIGFEFDRNEALTRLDLVKKGIEMFVHQKSQMNALHQFGLCLLGDNATWHTDFTSDVAFFLVAVNSLVATVEVQGFNMGLLLDLIGTKFSGLLKDHSINSDPHSVKFLVRVILIYGRSKQVPTLGNWTEEKMLGLLDNPVFFWDALYVHMKPGEPGNVVQAVYDFLTKASAPFQWSTPLTAYTCTRLKATRSSSEHIFLKQAQTTRGCFRFGSI